MRLFAALARFYGFSHSELMRMPWHVLLGYAGIMAEAQEEERLRTRYRSRAMVEDYRRNIDRWRAMQPPPR